MEIRYFDVKQDCIGALVSLTKTLLQLFDSETYVALTGGKTPKEVYRAFRGLDFSRTHVFIADERYVSPDHPDSNTGMINDALIKNNAIASFHTMNTEVPITNTIQSYAKELHNIPDNTFDIFFLGIGPDGHILSLFPHTQALHNTDFFVIETTTDMFAVQTRVTMTLSYVLKAKHLILFATGQDKLAVIRELERGEKSIDEMPVMALKNHPSLVIFYCS